MHATYLTIEFLPIGEQEIKSLKVMCSNYENGCGWVGELRSLDNHLTTCEYALICCTNECMENDEEVKILRHELEQHLRKCPNRQHQCPHCKDAGRYCDITTTHLDTCPKLEVPCPNSECTLSVICCKLSYHRSKCPFEVTCKYAGIGCKEKLPRKDVEQHENDDSFHLHLAMETVIEQQVKEKPCIFKMPEFEQHKSSQDIWYSPPFYTRPGGYKMCIGVDANGDGDAAGTHVSVFAYLMKGRNDDNLPWPFTEEIIITLLNQLADKNHHTRTISFRQDDEESRRVVDGERSSTGYGFPEFITHSRLDAQCLKDDCLYFRIEVTPPKPPKPWLTCTVKDYGVSTVLSTHSSSSV